MQTPAEVARDIATLLFLLRDRPDAREEHAAQFKSLIAALAGRGLDLRAGSHGLKVFNVPVPDTAPLVGALRTMLLDRGLGEVRLASTATPAQLLHLLRALTEPPGSYRSIHDLASTFESATRRILVLSPPASDDLKAPGDWNSYGENSPSMQTRSTRTDSLPEHLAALDADPQAADVPERLNEVVRATDELIGGKDWGLVLKVVAALVRNEQAAADSPVARSYAIALRRIMPRSVVEQIARLVPAAESREDAQLVLRRVGADATEALLALLASADQMEDRRAFFGALRQMTEGTDLLINMLTHDEWFVVRNVADLCGELRLDAAVPRLARHAQHDDERVRRSVAAALARIGTPGSLESLRALLRDKSAAVRLSLVQQVDARLRGLAMSLAVAMDEESNPEVVREIMLALGRIGTSEAVKALSRAGEPGGRLLRRKPLGTRLAAVEALAMSGSPSAEIALRTLSSDKDERVQAAAAAALGRPNETMVG